MKHCIVGTAAFLLLCLQSSLANSAGDMQADTSSSEFRWFPSAPLFPRLDADGTAEQLSLCKDLDTRTIVGSIGGVQRMFQTTVADFPVQVGVGATVYGNFIRMPHVLDVVTADFYVDFPLDIKLSDHAAFRTGWGHHSGHLVDDGIEALGHHSINYAKDYSPFLIALDFPAMRGFVYGGVRFDYYTIPAVGKHWNLWMGADGASFQLGGRTFLYAAFDLKIRQEVNWGTTQSYQIGIRTAVFGSQNLRFAYTYRTGPEERGQFFTQSTAYSLLGVFLDF